MILTFGRHSVHFWMFGRFRGRLRCGIRIWRQSGGNDNMPSSDDAVPPFTQAHLLLRGRGLLGVRGGRVACRGALSVTLGILHCKKHLHLFQPR
jgi:hypothetical protein